MKRFYAWLPLIAAIYLVVVVHLVYFNVLAFVDMTYLVLSAACMALLIGGWYLTVYVRINLDSFFNTPLNPPLVRGEMAERPKGGKDNPLDPFNWQEDADDL